ncbi:MAG: glycosyltransferase family 4 protein [Proteobacteria bacterium]|jgi:phosphatidyl-myo-inositol dimannoside synthase|nr:glycosyltransferase family 4 protein [Pseudomonadota bacterium]
MAKITLITRNFPPVRGGIERVVHQVYKRLSHQHHCDLVGPKGCKEYANTQYKVIETAASPAPFFLVASFFKSLGHLLRNGPPDIIVGGSGLMAPIVILLARLFRTKSIIMVYGLDIIVESWLYQRLFAPFLRRADLVIGCSKSTAELAIQKNVRAERIAVICPGVDLPETPLSHKSAKQALGVENKTLLLSVGRLIPRKGLAEFITHSFTDLAAHDPNLELWIVGSEPENALNRGGGSVQQAIEAAIKANKLETQVRLLDRVDDTELGQLYASADAFVFPLVETPGDVEGFGMVAIEASSYGTPTVAFDCGGVSDAIENGKNGYLVTPGNYGDFSQRITQVISEPLRQSCTEYAKIFSWEIYAQKLQACIDNL